MASDAGNEGVPPALNSEGPPSYTLFVQNVPDELEKDGVCSIFSEYGHVTGLVLVKSKKQAYISYSTYIAAERAIHDLHMKVPLSMNLQFQDKRLRSLHKPATVDLSGPLYDHRYKQYDIDFKNMKKAIDMGKLNCTPDFRPDPRTPDDDLLYPCPSSNDHSIFNPYEGPGPYYDTNIMYTRGITHISKDGRRLVSCGRGYTYYHLPEPHYDIPACLQRVYEKREHGHFEYASEDIENEIENCQVCGTPTSFKCQRCSITFYCNRNCQKSDWPNHKNNCHALPPLVKRISNLSLSNGSPKPQDHLRASSEELKSAPKAPRSPTSIENKEKPTMPVHHNKSSTEVSASSPRFGSHNGLSKEETKNESNRGFTSSNSEARTSTRTSPPKPKQDSQRNYAQSRQQHPYQSRPQHQQQQKPQEYQQPRSQQQQHPQQQKPHYNQQKSKSEENEMTRNQQQNEHIKNIASLKNSEEDIGFQEVNRFLPKNEFVDVIITVVNAPGEYWVHVYNNRHKLEEFKAVLAKAAEKVNMIFPMENIECVLKNNGEWYRASLLSYEEEKSEVLFHDYGVVDQIEVNKVFIQKFSEPHFARRIRLMDTVDENLMKLKDGDMLSVRALQEMADGTIIVQGKSSQIKRQKSPTHVSNGITKSAEQTDDEIFLSKLSDVPNIFDKIKEPCDGFVLLHSKVGPNKYCSSLVPTESEGLYNKLIADLANDCSKLYMKNPDFKPKIGDFICGDNESQEWYRGIVASVKPIKLAVIDECRFFVPVRCCPLPDGYEKIESVGLVCEMDSQRPEEMVIGLFKVTKISSDFINISIESSDKDVPFKGNAQVKKWTPVPEQKGVLVPTLVSGNKVIMTHLATANKAYVKIDEVEEVERVHKLEQEVSKCARNNPQPLKEKPVVGEMVLSSFDGDGNIYRAVVIKIDGDKILVKYIDYGNDEVRSLKHLFKISDSLKTQKTGCIQITLKGIDPNASLNSTASDYYQELIAGSATLICTFEGHPFKDGVTLKTLNNEIVNDVLKSALKPTYKTKNPEEDRNVYNLSSLPSAKIGEVGDEVSAIVLCHYEKSGNIVLAPDDINAVVAIQEEMCSKIQEYVAVTKNHYIPRDEELCIALYHGIYYRALCIDSVCSPNESTVYFIDYGNTESVNHTDIRQITPDFLTLPALAILCNMMSVMFPQGLSEAANKAVAELLPVNEKIIIKIVGTDDDLTPNIEVPSLRVKLTDAKLV